MRLTLLLILGVLSSCSYKQYTYKSERCIINEESSVLYFKNDSIGSKLYTYWDQGLFGKEYLPVLINENEFKSLTKFANRSN